MSIGIAAGRRGCGGTHSEIKSSVIFLRYADELGPRSHLYVVNVIHGRRDLDAYFVEHDDEDET